MLGEGEAPSAGPCEMTRAVEPEETEVAFCILAGGFTSHVLWQFWKRGLSTLQKEVQWI